MGFGIVIRVWGDYALFTRPEMKVERVTYDMITPSAARGVIEAVYWKPAIRWVIDRIHVMREPEFTNVRRNEVSVKASTSDAIQVMNGAVKPLFIDSTETRQQRAALVLKNVEYIIEAHFDINEEKAGADDTKEKHYNMILRRLRKGQFYSAPCLGTREFSANIELLEGDIPVSPLKGKRPLAKMLKDIDYSNLSDKHPEFFDMELVDGILDLTKKQAEREK